MRYLKTLAVLGIAVALPVHADMAYRNGPISMTLLSSGCSSEVAIKTLTERGATTEPKRADVMIAGEFIPACWSEDKDHDIIVIDRKGSGGVIYRKAFRVLPQV